MSIHDIICTHTRVVNRSNRDAIALSTCSSHLDTIDIIFQVDCAFLVHLTRNTYASIIWHSRKHVASMVYWAYITSTPGDQTAQEQPPN